MATAGSTDTYRFPVYQTDPNNPADTMSQPMSLLGLLNTSFIAIQAPNGTTQKIPFSALTVTQLPIKNSPVPPAVPQIFNTWVVSFRATKTTFPVGGSYIIEIYLNLPGGVSKSVKVVQQIDRSITTAFAP